MELSEIIFDMKLIGSLSHRDYDTMVKNWIIADNNPLPTYNECIEVWNTITYPRLLNQSKQEKISEVKFKANEILRLNHDWKVAKQFTTNCWTKEEFDIIKAEMQSIRDKSNIIENQIMNLTDLEDVKTFQIEFE